MNDPDLRRELRTTIDGAAAPVSVAEARLRARDTTSVRTGRRQPGPWTRRVMVVAVAAVILAAFFAPLPHVSLFKHLVTPAKPSTATSVPAGVSKSGALSAVSCTSATVCTAVGSYGNVTLAEAWNGTKWTVEPTPEPTGSQRSSLSGVSCTSAAVCTAVGSYGNVTLAEAWNGQTWAIEPTRNPQPSEGTHILLLGLSGVSCTSATACTAVGGYSYAGYYETLAEARNGVTWAIETTPNVSGATLSGVSCTSATACTAVGGVSADGASYTRLEAWNGKAWAIEYGGHDFALGTGSSFVGVSCTSPTGCTVVGSAAASGTLAETWNGKTLTFEPTLSSGVSFLGVSCAAPTACTAVGSYANSAGTEVPLAEAWNGKTWTGEPTPRPS